MSLPHHPEWRYREYAREDTRPRCRGKRCRAKDEVKFAVWFDTWKYRPLCAKCLIEQLEEHYPDWLAKLSIHGGRNAKGPMVR